MRYTIEDLANGKCAVINNGTLEELNKVLKLAFPNLLQAIGDCKYYCKDQGCNWVGIDTTNLPTQSVKDFLSEEKIEDSERKGDLKGFPKEVVEKMLERQFEQVGKKDISVFENNRGKVAGYGGFSWDKTCEGGDFWRSVIKYKNFDVFFEKYPKSENKEENPLFVEGQFITENFPRRMRVWDINKEDAEVLIVLAKANDLRFPFIVVKEGYEEDYLKGEKFVLSSFENAEELTTNAELEKLKEQLEEIKQKINQLENK